MEISFKIIKSTDTNQDEFYSAYYCAISAIESILFDFDVVISEEFPHCVVSTYADTSHPLYQEDIVKMIEGAFVDGFGEIYEQFHPDTPVSLIQQHSVTKEIKGECGVL